MTDQQISAMTAGTPAAADTFPFQRGGTANYAATPGAIMVGIAAPGASGNVLTSNGTAWTSEISSGASGWISAGITWTYASPTTFTIVGDYSAVLTKGMKFKLTANSVVLQGYILSAVYSSPNTTVTVIGDALTSHTFTENYYSTAANPAGFTHVFTVANPSMTVGYFDNGGGAQPTITKTLISITGTRLYVRIFGTGYKATTDQFLFDFTQSSIVAINTANYSTTSNTIVGTFMANGAYLGSVIYVQSTGHILSVATGSIPDNTVIAGATIDFSIDI